MNHDYRKFSEIDFLEDPYFRKWVYENDTEISEFWTSFLTENPDKVHCVEQARDALLMMRDLKDRHDTAQMRENARNIRANIDKAIHYPVLRTSNTASHTPSQATSIGFLSRNRLRIAAAIVVAIIAGVFVIAPELRFADPAVKAQTVVQTNPKGKRSMLTLPDGTQVWLNAESQLIYLNNFDGQPSREVFLVGEAFFDVAEDRSKPFVVTTSSIAIKVLGTRFNVQSYERDRTVSTTLVEGKISLGVVNGNDDAPPEETTSLSASQRAVFIKESKKLVLENNVKAEEYSNWREGKLYFDDKPITEVLAMIERWYDVNIHLDNPALEHCTFSAKIDNKTLKEVLELFSASTTDGITYSISDKEVFIKGRLCQ